MAIAVAVVGSVAASAQQPRDQPTWGQQTRSTPLYRDSIAERQKWQGYGRVVAGKNSAALRLRAIRQRGQIRALSSIPGMTGAWVSLGPTALPSDASGTGIQDYGFVSGRATAVAIDPNDPSGNTVFVGGAYAGVWKSTNAGPLSLDPSAVRWTPLTDGQATLAIGSIAVQPQLSNPNSANSIVLAGTGETDNSTDSYYGLGILRSLNGGLTWRLISQDTTGTHSFAGLGFSQIAFNSTNPSLVVAAAGSASQGILEGLEDPVAANRGLYLSSDAGASWQATNVSDSGAAISPDSATAVAYNAAAGRFYAAIRFHGFYSSGDGVNWTRLPNQPGAGLSAGNCPSQEILPSVCPIYRGEIAVVPARAGHSGLGEMYVWYVDANDADEGIWTSVDGGVSWTQIDDSSITNCGDVLGGCGTGQGSFDLTLLAVPNGAATDLYAGAVNIYKCTITDSFPTCNGTGHNTFMNLTHAYGCSEIARVHPNQHGMDFLIANGVALIFFANDGGVDRALNGYTGLSTGVCGETNQFDNLNQTLGPMTQFVSLSQSSTDPNLIFGGTQDNGAPATAFAQSLGSWVNVDAGDNGFTAVNPSNEQEWFVATPPNSISGVNVFRCANGIACHSQDFANDQVAESNALDGDTGPFYLPFIFDPQNPATLILGTCRIWSGATSGGSFSLRSPNFETGGTGSCSGDAINTVRAIAAGGLTDSNGLSQVIYASTNGEGPLISTTPVGGRVWVTMNADGGPLSWSDATQQINPNGFPISSIAVDSTDPLGKTAYVTIMGFHTSHVWKTTDAGASWTDFTANLPDAPVNAIVLDSGASLSNGTVYVGTDVGVFASSTGTANWIEVGPSSGQSGFLPNVAVTSLQIFNSGGLKRLRAATYGRGIWEWNLITTPDFQINVSNNPLTMFPAQTVAFNGTILALNRYASHVNLTCFAGPTNPPQTCAPNPASPLPEATGTPFALNVGGTVGDYLFNLRAIGTDGSSITHDFPLALHIVDFTLDPPAPNVVTVAPGTPSSSMSLQLSPLGSFSGTISLSCLNLPAGATCQFQPSSSVSVASGSSTSVNLTVTTLSSTPVGTFPVTISAATSAGPAKTQNFTLVVSNTPDYSMSIANTSLSAAAGTQASFNGALTAMNGYGSVVNITCGAGAPSICTPKPTSVTPSYAGTPFSVTVSSGVSQAFNFSIVAKGTDSGATTHSQLVTFTATPAQSFDFTMGVTPPNASEPAGQPATFVLNVSPTTGSFPANVTFSCSKLPALTTCAFNPVQVGAGSQNSDVQLTITTTAAVSAAAISFPPLLLPILPFAGLAWKRRRTRKGRWHRHTLSLVLIFFLLGCVSCGGGLQGGGGGGSGSPGTPPGTYTITVTATCGAVTHSSQVSLTVTR
ncbi:MAG TPA: hypothetical protein VFA85_01275 [Terriglobales bacterium]|nr:hypothetical protein [Terriglobales bacterium]